MASRQNGNRPAEQPRGIQDEKGALALVGQAHEQFIASSKHNPGELRLSWERESAFAAQILLKDDRLRGAEQNSIVHAVANLASIGLTLNPLKQHCAMVARWNRNFSGYEAGIMVMVKGFIYLGNLAGVKDIDAEVVYQADEFRLIKSDEGPKFTHEINHLKARGVDDNPFVGAYCMATMPDSTRAKVEWVPEVDILKMRAASDSAWVWENGKKTEKPATWNGWWMWFDEYAKKGAIKRAQKRWEEAALDSERWQHFQRAVAADNHAEAVTLDGEATRVGKDVIEPTITAEQAADLAARVDALKQRDPKRYIHQICQAYRVDALAKIPQSKLHEVQERIAATKKEIESRTKK